MSSDSAPNVSFPATVSNLKDFAKKKRTNRSAKLKQCKLDARREQWLSQVKNKGCKEEMNGGGGGGLPASAVHRNESNRSLENLEINPRGEETEGSIHHYSDDSESSPSNSPTSSLLGTTDSGTNYNGSSSSSSTSSGGCCSGSISEEEGDDGCLDDWESVADALAATDDKHHNLTSDLESPAEHEIIARSDSPPELTNRADSGLGTLKPECVGMAPKAPASGQAWRPDDAFRPQSLPTLSKQHSFPLNSDRRFGWACKSVISTPSSCPICYEDLDLTDSSFLPCLCGFRLCLFCHKRILEEDGRCPGCRKPYDNGSLEGEASSNGGCLTFRLARSCSMITRS